MRRMITKNQLDNEIKVVKKDISTLVDKNGNDRFVEGAISTSEITGVTFTYAKWSLCGTHLMIVLCGEIANGTTLSTAEWGYAELPKYIRDKIVPVFATNYIAVKGDKAYYDDWNSVSCQNALYKSGDGVKIQCIDATTTTDKAHFRIQYDLLIDAE